MASQSHETCPYKGLPAGQYWRQSMAETAPDVIDPVLSAPFTISPQDKVATAGSCFAQHIAKNLTLRGFNYYVAEGAPKAIPADIAYKYNYGVFSARFGNLYTARQLLQLIDRAYGRFTPAEKPWQHGDRWFDPFRPSVETEGYVSLAHYEADLQHHLACVRTLFETLDVFVFTLGLTETWMSREDGAVFPVAPGCGYGAADMAKYKFHNFSVGEVVADMTAFLARLKEVNPKARVVITVSPVPLIATYEHRHVLVSTTYSKSVLRVAADEIERARQHVLYFPSYEIITGPHGSGKYYGPDLRDIHPKGVDHVMRVFFKHLSSEPLDTRDAAKAASVSAPLRSATDIICDEELLVGGANAENNR